VLVLLVASGCSFIHVRGPSRPRSVDEPVECSDSTATPTGDLVVGLIGVGAVGLVVAHAREEPPQSPGAGVFLGFVALTGVVVGLVGGTSAAYGYSTVSKCRRVKRAHAAAYDAALAHDADRKRTLDTAWERTQAAATAARSGDCATVTKLDAEVRAVDADFHATVFLRDVAIARCLDR
jgi:hypothetical protein